MDSTESDVVVPVLFVALHACGSLTPDILRAFLLASTQPPAAWKPFGVVAVGCCYNLMNPTGANSRQMSFLLLI